MECSSDFFIDGQRCVFGLEQKHKERKEFSAAHKKLKELFSKFTIHENQDHAEFAELVIAGFKCVIKNQPAEKLDDVVAHVQVSMSTILGKWIDYADLKAQITEALDTFKETRTQEDFLRFKSLYDRYRSLLNNQYREISQVLIRLKVPAAFNPAWDFRYLLRVRSKLIARNVDDEDSFSVKVARIFNRSLFTLENKLYGHTIPQGHYGQFGSLLQ